MRCLECGVFDPTNSFEYVTICNSCYSKKFKNGF